MSGPESRKTAHDPEHVVREDVWDAYEGILENGTERLYSAGSRLCCGVVFMISDLLTQDGWTGFVKGRRPQDFASLARVAATGK